MDCRRLLREGVCEIDGEAVLFDTSVRAAATSESESSSTLSSTLLFRFDKETLFVLVFLSAAHPIGKRGVRFPTVRDLLAVGTQKRSAIKQTISIELAYEGSVCQLK